MTLVGKGAGYEDIAAEFGCNIISQLDMNFIGMPLAGSLVDIAMNASEDVSVIVNSEFVEFHSYHGSSSDVSSTASC